MLRGACLILVLFLGACSSTQFAYNRADWFVRWQIEKLVDLSADQQARLETHVDQLHDWHRRQELPRYHALILQLQATLKTGVTDANYQQLSTELEQVWLRLLDKSLQSLAQEIPSLSDKQAAQLLDSLSEKNDEFYRKWVVIPEEELIERRRERVMDTLAQWTGEVTPAQRERVEAWASTAPDVYTLWHSQRLERHAVFEALLDQRNDRDLQEPLRALMVVDEQALQPWERRRLDDNRRRANELMVWLGQNLTAGQRSHLLEELGEIAEDIRQLQSQG